MKNYLQVFCISALAVLLFASGYLSRGILGEWLETLYQKPFWYQFVDVFTLCFGVLTATAALCISVLIFAFMLFLFMASMQEIKYQFWDRAILHQIFKKIETEKKVKSESPRERAQRLARLEQEAERQRELHAARRFEAEQRNRKRMSAVQVDQINDNDSGAKADGESMAETGIDE